MKMELPHMRPRSSKPRQPNFIRSLNSAGGAIHALAWRAMTIGAEIDWRSYTHVAQLLDGIQSRLG
jgi:hypothetical protein